jgi:hypothetical protein
MNEEREQVHQIQRDAIWKWRWLGFGNSTPGFKGSLLLLALAAGYIVFRALAH